jgi:hypothetical protein
MANTCGVTEDLARALAEELPRARRRMWMVLAVGLVAMAALLGEGLFLMHQMSSSSVF